MRKKAVETAFSLCFLGFIGLFAVVVTVGLEDESVVLRRLRSDADGLRLTVSNDGQVDRAVLLGVDRLDQVELRLYVLAVDLGDDVARSKRCLRRGGVL